MQNYRLEFFVSISKQATVVIQKASGGACHTLGLGYDRGKSYEQEIQDHIFPWCFIVFFCTGFYFLRFIDPKTTNCRTLKLLHAHIFNVIIL